MVPARLLVHGGLPAFLLRSERRSRTAVAVGTGTVGAELSPGSREEREGHPPRLAVRAEGEEEAKLFLTLM